jgi:hypothetical protein
VVLINPTTSTSTGSQDHETTPSENQNSEKEAGSSPKPVDTGYDRFIQRHCKWKQLSSEVISLLK